MLQVLNFSLKVLLQAREERKKRKYWKNGQVSKRGKKKRKKRKIAHDLYAHA
jgi:hypothetical protein